jgi:2-phospho-L-lactate/phosphoenolpyruvate guanylyltransferase
VTGEPLLLPTGQVGRDGWCVVLPVKGGNAAKSRLRRGWPGHDGAEAGALVAALAADTVAAVLSCELVDRAVVVSSAAGAEVVAESRPSAGLLAAVADGVRHAAELPVAVLLADLPAARPGDLTAALVAATAVLWGPEPAVMVALPDTEGSGTVLLAARRPSELRPAFGRGSCAEHRRLGAAVLHLSLPRLQRDVDTVEDLRHAAGLGLGPHSTAALAALSRPLPVA